MPTRPRPPLITLSVGTGPTGRGLALWGPGAPPAAGELPDDALELAAREVRGALRAASGLLLADSDVDAAGRERTAAAHIAALLEHPGAREVRDALIGLAARHGPLRLLIDARTDAARALPWELLAALPPGRGPLGGVQILRLLSAPPRATPSPGDRLHVRLWVADPDDPVSARAADRARRAAEAAGAVVTEVPADLSGRPGDPGPAVLHVVTHGSATLARVGLHAPGGARSADAVSHGLSTWAAGCRLAVVDVCQGAEATPDPADAPAWRLALAGLPAVVGPRTRWSEDAAHAFASDLYAHLAAGRTVAAAVEAGRTALRMLAVAHDSCRWWTPLLVLTAPPAADLVLRTPAPQLPGWPAPGPGAAAVLRAAADRARGYLGVEHLLAALADPAVAVPDRLAALRPALAEAAAARPPRPLSGDAAPSPRLQALGPLLPDRFPATALARVLAVVPWVARALDPAARARLLAPDDDSGHGTLPLETLPLDADSGADPAATGLHLEVEGGPDDGLRIALTAPGTVIGRWDPTRPEDTAGRLQVGRRDADRTLSRQHLRVTAPGVVEVRGATRWSRAGGTLQRVQGELALQPGDTLVLGGVTTVRVVG